jgi:hypothetical protein
MWMVTATGRGQLRGPHPSPASMAVLTGKSGLDGEPLVPANGSPAG